MKTDAAKLVPSRLKSVPQWVVHNVLMVGPPGAEETLLARAVRGQMNLSARGYHRVVKLAQPIADVAGGEQI